jgi:hypothetical protein
LILAHDFPRPDGEIRENLYQSRREIDHLSGPKQLPALRVNRERLEAHRTILRPCRLVGLYRTLAISVW